MTKLRSLVFALLAGFSGMLLAADPEPVKTAYLHLQPAIIGNFISDTPKLKVFKADISLRVNSNTIDRVEYHAPLIRDQLVLLFSQQTEDSFATVAAKEELRREALQLVQKVLEREESEILVQDLLFNNLIP